MLKREESRFLYRASALGAGGTFTKPYNEFLESQASSVLAICGGVGQSRVENFAYRNIVSFAAAETHVLGQPGSEPGTYSSLATAMLEGFNTLNMVTVERLMARLAWRNFTGGAEASFQTVGSHFENLRVAGQAVTVTLDSEVISEWDTYSKARDGMMKRIGKEIPFGQIIGTTIIAKVTQPAGAVAEGNRIDIPEFGSIYLGELFIEAGSRRLTMMRIKYGCPVDGGGEFGGAEGNGHTFP